MKIWAIAAALLLSQLPPRGPLPPPPGQSTPQADQPPREGTGLILGRVVEAGSGRPIGSAAVTLAGAGLAAADGGTRALSDSEGFFVFRRLPAGSFFINTTKPGFLAGAYGRRRPDGTAHQLTLAEGQRLGDVTILMWRAAAISGVIVDESGEPICGVNVRAYSRTFVGGRPRLRMAGNGTTDDRGVYRIWTLAPGEYIIGVESTTAAVPLDVARAYQAGFESSDPARLALSREVSLAGAMLAGYSGVRAGDMLVSGRAALGGWMPNTGGPFVYPTTFYPAAMGAAQARTIAVASGEDRGGVDIQLRPVPAVRVSGIATTPDGPAKNVAVRLTAAGAEVMAADLDVATTITDASGAFTFLGVPAGQYTVSMLQQPPPPPRAATGTGTMIQVGNMTIGTSFGTGPIALQIPDGPTYFETIPLSVGAKDVSNVSLALRPAGRVTGRVEFDGAAPRPSAENLQRIRIVLEPARSTTTANRVIQGGVDADGQLKTPGVPAGRYYLRVLGVAAPWTFKSAIYQGRDVADSPIDATGGDIAGVVLTFTDAASELSGSVTTDGRPDPDATVLLFPTDVESWIDTGAMPRRLRAVRTTSTGTFSTRGLPAGNYYAVAVPDEFAADWQDPKYLESLVAAASQVRMDDGQNKTLTLRTTRPR